MIRILLIASFLCVVFHLQGQWIIKGIKTQKESQLVLRTQSAGPVSLPFWDDFSTTNRTPGALWNGGDSVFVNPSLAIAPPSLNVATFDGLDHTGLRYSESATLPDVGDRLTSCPILLDGLNVGDSVYLSFFWQAGGNGEIPDPEDEFKLFFKNNLGEWIEVWTVSGGASPDDQFTQEIIRISDASFFHNGFQIRFESSGSLLGPFDTWHLDYVYLNSGRSSNDLTYLDRAMTGTISSLLGPYREIPSTHFFSDPDKYVVRQSYQGSNLDNTLHTLVVDYSLTNTNTMENFSFTDGDKFFNIGEQKTAELDNQPTIPPKSPAPDSTVFVLEIGSNFGDSNSPVDFTINDLIRDTIRLLDYYAYDDGLAEYAGGIAQFNGQVAVEYALDTADTLTHIDIYFPSAEPTPVGQSVDIMVWSALDNDSVLITKRITVPPSQGRDVFTRIPMDTLVVVRDTIYVGYRQKTSNYFGIGVDRNNPAANDKMWFRVSQEWQQNQNLNGVLMIRPVFETGFDLPVLLGVGEVPNRFQLYPNPSTGRINILEEYQELKVYDTTGRVVYVSDRQNDHDLRFLPDGIYLLHLKTRNGTRVNKLKIQK